jgi:hypothetical protein
MGAAFAGNPRNRGAPSMTVRMRYAVPSPNVREDVVTVLEARPTPLRAAAGGEGGLQRTREPHAQGGIRTRTPFGATPSRWCVYQFHHLGLKEDGLRIRDPRPFPVPP